MMVDDDPEFDQTLYERRYWPKRVFKDGKGPRVSLMLTDGMPDWMRRRPHAVCDAPGYRPPVVPRYVVNDGQMHRPGYLLDHIAGRSPTLSAYDSEQVHDARRLAELSRDRWVSEMTDAWRLPINDRGMIAREPDDADDDGGDPEAARDAYVRRTQNAYRRPINGRRSGYDDEPADRIEAMRRRVTHEPMDGAALADRDHAYAEYVARISNAWRR
jgi:hypothetical protein